MEGESKRMTEKIALPDYLHPHTGQTMIEGDPNCKHDYQMKKNHELMDCGHFICTKCDFERCYEVRD